MALRVYRLSPHVVRRWANTAAAVPLSEPLPFVHFTPESAAKRPVEGVKVSKLANGVTVASVETSSVTTHVSVLVKAGSRYETYERQGLTHLLRNCAFLATNDRTAFRIARETDLIGGTLKATSSREHVIYSSGVLKSNLDAVMSTLGNVISSSKFQAWEVDDQKERIKLELAQFHADPTQVLMEELHRIAYRNALSNPLYCPSYNLPNLNNKDLKSFVEEWYTGKRMIIVGVGTGHEDLKKAASAYFGSIPEGLRSAEEQAEYVGGGEVRLPSADPLTYATVVCKGVSLSSDSKEILAAGVLQHILGVGSYVKWGSGTSTARLSKAVEAATDAPSQVSAINISYSDSGLFGLSVVCPGSVAGKVLKSAVREFSDVARGNISTEDLARAKNQLKANVAMSTENSAALIDDIGIQLTVKGSYLPVEETFKQIDSLTKEDVVKVARAVFSTRPTLVASGNLSSTPRLDHLMSGVSLK